jgi:DNA polymerase III delta subunit
MPEIPFFTYLKNVESGKQMYPVTLVFGYNEFLGERIIRALDNAFLENKDEFNYRRYYFDPEFADTSWEEIISEANSSSFFVQSRKLIVVTIRDTKKITLLKYDKQLLTSYLKKPNTNTILVIYISLNVIKDDFKQVKTQKINKLLKDVTSPNCTVVDLDKLNTREVKSYIKQYLNKGGMTITASGLDKIFEIKEDDYISVLYQLPRLEIADVENRSLDSEDIERLVTGVEAHSIWDLTDAMESQDAAKYLKILKYLFMNGIGATLIIGTLITHYNKLYIGKFLLKRGMPASDVGKALGQHPYFLNKFISSANRFPQKRLNEILKIIYELDYESKTSGEEKAKLSLQNFTFRLKLLRQGR